MMILYRGSATLYPVISRFKIIFVLRNIYVAICYEPPLYRMSPVQQMIIFENYEFILYTKYILYSTFKISFFGLFRHKPRQLILEYYLHLTITFEIYFSDSSNENHNNLLYRIVPTLYDHDV